MVRPIIRMNKILNLEEVVDYIINDCSTLDELDEMTSILIEIPCDDIVIANQISALLNIINNNRQELVGNQNLISSQSMGNVNTNSKVMTINPVNTPRSHYSSSLNDNRGLMMSILLVGNILLTGLMYALLFLGKVIIK